MVEEVGKGVVGVQQMLYCLKLSHSFSGSVWCHLFLVGPRSALLGLAFLAVVTAAKSRLLSGFSLLLDVLDHSTTGSVVPIISNVFGSLNDFEQEHSAFKLRMQETGYQSIVKQL